jgi:YegS/Rv2252/BmrU family lipid kinase
MAKALVIINPAAARTRAASVAAVAAAIRAGGWEAEVLATGGPGDARVLAEYGVQQGVDVVAVFGGDGTTMQAAAALVGTDVILGVIPGGTGNLLAGNLRIPAAPARAAEVIVRGKPKAFDLGHMERPGGSQYFAVACGAGYDARVMAGTASAMKHKWKFAAYVATTFRLLDELRIARHYITVDGVEYEAEAAMVLVANCGEVIPPFVRLRSGITPDDGMLDVIVLKASNVPESVRAIWHLLTERAEGEFIRYGRGQEVRVVTEPIEPVQLDGEPGGVTPFTATIVPGAIRVMVPV